MERLRQHRITLIILGILAVLTAVMAALVYDANRRIGNDRQSPNGSPVATSTDGVTEAAEETRTYVPPPSLEEREAQVESIKEKENPSGLTAEERRQQSAELEVEQNPNNLSREERQAQIDALEGR